MPDATSTLDVTEVVPGVHRMALPLGIHGVPTVSAYLLHGDDGDVLVDCGIAAGPEPPVPEAEPDPCGALAQALRMAGSRLERISRLVVTHAHIDHFGLAGEVVRRSGGELWMHEAGRLDLDKYHDPDEAVDRRMLMLADHGLYGRELTESSEGLLDWMPVMPSIAAPDRVLAGGERIDVGDRGWEVVHTPGHSPGHVCLWSAADRLLIPDFCTSPDRSRAPGCGYNSRSIRPRLIAGPHPDPFEKCGREQRLLPIRKRSTQVHGLLCREQGRDEIILFFPENFGKRTGSHAGIL